MIRKFVATTIVCSCLLSATAACAGDAATAEALFRDGRALMNAGNYSAACPKLEESFAQDPATGTLLALGICQEHVGKTASAWATYAEVASRAKRDGRADREQAAREHIAALEPKLSRLTIVVDRADSALPGFVVKRDGQVVGSGAWGVGVPLDAGEHVVEASAPGKLVFRAKLSIGAQSDTQTVKVPVLELDPNATPLTPPPNASVASAPDADARTQPASSKAGVRTAGLIVGGAGIVALGVSGIFALRAKSQNDDSNADGHCDAQNRCDATGGSARDSAKSSATAATIALLAGSALTLTGVTLFVLGSTKTKEHTARIEAVPVFGFREAAFVLNGRF